MFESLSEKLQAVFERLGRKGRLSEEDVDLALREVRVALLEADVSLKVVRQFVAAIKEKAVGQDVVHSLTPAQTVIKIVHDQLVELLGTTPPRLTVSPKPPTVVLWSASRARVRPLPPPSWRCRSRRWATSPYLSRPIRTARPRSPSYRRSVQQVDVPVFHDPSKKPPELAQAASSTPSRTGTPSSSSILLVACRSTRRPGRLASGDRRLALLAAGAIVGNPLIGIAAGLIAAASAGFLVHNLPPARLFMGDVGSTFLGFSFAGAGLLGNLGVGGGRLPIEFGIVILAPFLFDSIVTLARRIARGERWYAAHRSHYYQRLVRAWRLACPGHGAVRRAGGHRGGGRAGRTASGRAAAPGAGRGRVRAHAGRGRRWCGDWRLRTLSPLDEADR